MTNLKVALDNLEDVLECKTNVEALKDEINNLSKILDAVKPDEANEVAEILNDGEIAKEIEQVYHIVYELVGDLSEGAIKGVTRCAACEKVLVEGHDEIREWTGSSLCEYCYDEFSRQAEEEIGIDDSEEASEDDDSDGEKEKRLTALIAMQSEAKEDKVDGIFLFSGWFDSLSDNAKSKAYSEIYSQAALYESIE